MTKEAGSLIIDAHNHADWYGHDMHKTLENMDACGIDRAWMLTWEVPEDERDPYYIKNIRHNPEPGYSGIAFERCLAYKAQRPDRFILGYAPDPRRPDAIDRLSSAIDLYGVQVYGELKLRMMYDNPDALRMFRFCGQKGLPVTVHIDYEFDTGVTYPRPNYWYGGGIDAFERAVKKCPETIFLGHAPGFWAHISGDDQYDKTSYPTGKVQPGGRVQAMLDRYPNLYCDMSAGSGLNALRRDPDHAKTFLLAYQDRLLYARDYFDNDLQTFLRELSLPQAVLDKLYCRNAQRLLGE